MARLGSNEVCSPFLGRRWSHRRDRWHSSLLSLPSVSQRKFTVGSSSSLFAGIVSFKTAADSSGAEIFSPHTHTLLPELLPQLQRRCAACW